MRVLLLVLLLASGIAAHSQVQGISKKSPLMQRFYFGGGLDLAFDQNVAIVGGSPILGFMVTRSTSIGTGVTYQYIQNRITGVSGNIFGYRIFVRQNLIAQFFAYAEYEKLGYKSEFDNSRFWFVPEYRAGGGFFQSLSERAGFQAMILYTVSNSRETNNVGNPWTYRAGFVYSPF